MAARDLTDRARRGPLLVTRRDAAAMLSMSIDSFERHCQPELRLVRTPGKVLVPVAELRKWVELNSRRTLEMD